MLSNKVLTLKEVKSVYGGNGGNEGGHGEAGSPGIWDDFWDHMDRIEQRTNETRFGYVTGGTKEMPTCERPYMTVLGLSSDSPNVIGRYKSE